MRRACLVLGLVTLVVQQSVGGEIVQSRDYEVQPDTPNSAITFDPFDDSEGRRRMESIDVGYSGHMDFGFEVLNYDETPYAEGEWSVDAYLNALLAFEARDGFEDGGPFFGLGGVAITRVTGELGAGTGGGPFGGGNPGDPTVEASTSGPVEGFVSLTSDLDYFLVDEPLSAVVGPLWDIVITPPPGSFFIDTRPTFTENSGVVTMTYHYGLVGDFNGDDQLNVTDIDQLYEKLDIGGEQFDLDANGLVEFADVEYLIEHLMGVPFGDVNFDGAFDSSDLVILFQAGTYEDKIARNATWSTGDFNGDRDFDSSDLVVALAKGSYSSAAVAVPELSSGTMMLVALFGLLRIRRSLTNVASDGLRS